MSDRLQPLALYDLDNTLADYNKAMIARLAEMLGPTETVALDHSDGEPAYLKARRKAVQADPRFWRDLDLYRPGLELWDLTHRLGFRHMILTQGPTTSPVSWTEKLVWVQNKLDADVPVTVTRDKSLTYGRVLVDDWPPYVFEWLAHRPRGLAVMPAHDWNAGLDHPQIVRYTGDNIAEVEARLLAVRDRVTGG